jgi:ABC-type uncharacterized transport system permease subunit
MPVLGGIAVTLGCKGALMWKRIVVSAICGCVIGTLFTATSIYIILNKGFENNGLMRYWALIIFIFSILSAIGAIITEMKLPEVELNTMVEQKG